MLLFKRPKLLNSKIIIVFICYDSLKQESWNCLLYKAKSMGGPMYVPTDINCLIYCYLLVYGLCMRLLLLFTSVLYILIL